MVKDFTNVNKTPTSHLKSFNTEQNEHPLLTLNHLTQKHDLSIANLVLGFGQLIGSQFSPFDAYIDLLVHHEVQAVTHSSTRFNYSPLKSNQCMNSCGLWSMILKMAHIVEEKYTSTYRKINGNFLEERMCYIKCSIC